MTISPGNLWANSTNPRTNPSANPNTRFFAIPSKNPSSSFFTSPDDCLPQHLRSAGARGKNLGKTIHLLGEAV